MVNKPVLVGIVWTCSRGYYPNPSPFWRGIPVL